MFSTSKCTAKEEKNPLPFSLNNNDHKQKETAVKRAEKRTQMHDSKTDKG